MSNDLLLVLGIIVAVLSIPSFIGAFSSGEKPRGALIMAVLGGALIAAAVLRQPSGYDMADVPNVFMGVMADILR